MSFKNFFNFIAFSFIGFIVNTSTPTVPVIAIITYGNDSLIRQKNSLHSSYFFSKHTQPVYIHIKLSNTQFFLNKDGFNADREKYMENFTTEVSFEFSNGILYMNNNGEKTKIDWILPIIHGKGLSDGYLQKFFANLGFERVISNSAVKSVKGSNKLMVHTIASELGIKSVPTVLYKNIGTFDSFCTKLKCSKLFIKPTNQGLSLGCHMVSNQETFESAIKDAQQYEDVIIQPYLENFFEASCSKIIGEDQTSEIFAWRAKPEENHFSTKDKEAANYNRGPLDFEFIKTNLGFTLTEDQIKQCLETIQKWTKLLFDEFSDYVMRADFAITSDGDVMLIEINLTPGMNGIMVQCYYPVPKSREYTGQGPRNLCGTFNAMLYGKMIDILNKQIKYTKNQKLIDQYKKELSFALSKLEESERNCGICREEVLSRQFLEEIIKAIKISCCL